MLGWKTGKCFRITKPTKLRNPRPTQPKTKTFTKLVESGIWPAFFPLSKLFFVGWDRFRKHTTNTRNPTQPKLSANPLTAEVEENEEGKGRVRGGGRRRERNPETGDGGGGVGQRIYNIHGITGIQSVGTCIGRSVGKYKEKKMEGYADYTGPTGPPPPVNIELDHTTSGNRSRSEQRFQI